MATQTLAELRTRLRRLTDTEVDAHKTDTELNSLLSEARQEVHEILLRADPDWYESTATISTTGITDTYALPADHHHTKGIEWLATTGFYEPLRRITFRDRLDYQVSGVAQSATAYRIVGSNVVLYPFPPTGQTYRHVYVPAAIALSADATTVDAREAEMIVLRAAIRVIAKERGDTAVFERMFDAEKGRMVAFTEDRAILESTVVADVESFEDDWMMPRPLRRM